MARAYTMRTSAVSVTAVQDLVSIQTTSGMVCELDELNCGQVTATTIGNLNCSFKRFSGGYAIGSGGTSVTPRPHLFGDAAATCTGRANDTVQTSGGTSVVLDSDVFNVINGYIKLPAPEDRWAIAMSQAFVWSLDSAPGSSESMTVKACFRETV